MKKNRQQINPCTTTISLKLIHVTSLKYKTSFAYIYIVSHIMGVLISALVHIFFKEGAELEERRGLTRASLDHS